LEGVVGDVDGDHKGLKVWRSEGLKVSRSEEQSSCQVKLDSWKGCLKSFGSL